MIDKLDLVDWDRYKVCENGDVIPLSGIIAGKPFKQFIKPNGYSSIALVCKDGAQSKFYVHRIIAYHFLDNPNNLPQVNHIDGDKQNNDVSNLEWCTPKQNSQHALKNGLLSEKTFLPSGELNKKSKVKDSEVYAIRGMHRMGLTQKALAEHFCIDQSTVSCIVNNKTWRHLL